MIAVNAYESMAFKMIQLLSFRMTEIEQKDIIPPRVNENVDWAKKILTLHQKLKEYEQTSSANLLMYSLASETLCDILK